MVAMTRFAAFKRYFVRGIGLLIALPVLFLCLRPLVAQPLDLPAYTPDKAEEYFSLPLSGSNFSAGSSVAYAAGRYYLKGKTTACVLAAYADLERDFPQYSYLYGEMGWNGGGRFRPHRTHQEGLNADFMTPMYRQGENGERMPAQLPCSATNLWGYNIRLDEAGRYEDLTFDTAAAIAHLEALSRNAPRYGLRVQRVIFDPPMLRLLQKDPSYSRIKGLNFLETKAWFPHDGHYHVDFAPAK